MTVQRFRRILLTALVSAASLAVSAHSATKPTVAVEPDSGLPGQIVTVKGRGFCHSPACGRVRIDVYGVPAATGIRVSRGGMFATRVKIPGGGPSGEIGLIATQRLADGTELRAFSIFKLVVGARATHRSKSVEKAKPSGHRSGSQPAPTATARGTRVAHRSAARPEKSTPAKHARLAHTATGSRQPRSSAPAVRGTAAGRDSDGGPNALLLAGASALALAAALGAGFRIRSRRR